MNRWEKVVYDWVDQTGRIVGKGPAKRARLQGYFTQSVHILLTDSRGHVFICKRSLSKQTYPGLFTSSAGGRVDQGETYHQAAIRELKEELGVTTRLTDAGRFDVVNEREATIHRLYTGTLKKTDALKCDPAEIALCKFVSFSKLWRDSRRHPEKYAAPFLAALGQYARALVGPTFVLDFDHTLFDWYGYKDALRKKLKERLSVSSAVFERSKIQQESKGLYNITAHLAEIAKASGVSISKINELHHEMQKRMPKYIFRDARALLQRLRKKDFRVVVLTYGDTKNQRHFIEATGVRPYAHRIFYAPTMKKKVELLAELLKRPTSVVFINDDPKETDLIHKHLPYLGWIYLVERPSAKYKKIQRKQHYIVVDRLTNIPV